jgi:hypothetical protein
MENVGVIEASNWSITCSLFGKKETHEFFLMSRQTVFFVLLFAPNHLLCFGTVYCGRFYINIGTAAAVYKISLSFSTCGQLILYLINNCK